MTFNSGNRSPLFHLSIDKLFNNWTALQLAVENGQGGGYGKDIALWMRGAVEDFFYQNDGLDGEEVAEFLAELMNQELDTVVSDGSLEELGAHLCTHFALALANAADKLQGLHEGLDAAAKGAKPKAQAQPQGDDDSSEDDEEAMDMDTSEDNGQSSANSSQNAQNPQNRRTGHNFVSEPDPDGWVTVVKPRK